MIEITRHEKEGILQGFTFYAPDQITLLVHDNELWYSKTKYRGHCSVGAVNQNVNATAFESDAAANEYINNNNLVKFGDHYEAWHHEKDQRIVQTKTGNIRMMIDYPELAQYPQSNGVELVESGNYVYMYANEILPEHQTLFETEKYEAIIQQKP